MATTTINGAGVAAILRSNTKTLNKDGVGADGAIVGTGAGALAHTAGITLVAGVANKIIIPLAAHMTFDFVTAAYTGGTNVFVRYVTGPITTMGGVSAANSFGASTDRVVTFGLDLGSQGAATSVVGESLILRTDSEFTQPGTADGTARIVVFYMLVDAP